MSSSTCSSKTRSLWRIAGGAVLVVGIVTIVKAVPDIVRYMKIRAM